MWLKRGLPVAQRDVHHEWQPGSPRGEAPAADEAVLR